MLHDASSFIRSTSRTCAVATARAVVSCRRSSRSGETLRFCSCVFRSLYRSTRTWSRRTSSFVDPTPSTTTPLRFPYTPPGSSRAGKRDPSLGRCSLAPSKRAPPPRWSSPADPRWSASMCVNSLDNGRNTTLAIKASRSWPTTRHVPERRLRFGRSVQIVARRPTSFRGANGRVLSSSHPSSSPTSSCTCVENSARGV